MNHFKKAVFRGVLAIATAAVISKACFASDIVPMDGSIVKFNSQQLWSLDGHLKNIYDGVSWFPNHFTCTFKTDYQGNGGVEINVSNRMMHHGLNEYGKNMIVKIDEPVVIVYDEDIYSIDTKDLFRQPAIRVIDKGCSTFKDGDTCKHDSSNYVFGSCTYIS